MAGGRTRHKAVRGVRVRTVRRFRMAVKAAPMPPDPSMQPGGEQPPEEDPNQPPADDGRQWAGDPYDEGDETQPDDPSVTNRFTGQGGDEAWLERAEDGTLTGWVRDGTGQVYRYSDVDAWAIDVDDAAMAPSGGAPAAPDGQDPGAAPDADPYIDPNADPSTGPSTGPGADPEEEPDPAGTDPDEDDEQSNRPPWMKNKKK